jgi:hypothetical protein
MGVPVDTLVVIFAILFTVFVVLGVTGRAWQRRHTYNDEFWHSNGW